MNAGRKILKLTGLSLACSLWGLDPAQAQFSPEGSRALRQLNAARARSAENSATASKADASSWQPPASLRSRCTPLQPLSGTATSLFYTSNRPLNPQTFQWGYSSGLSRVDPQACAPRYSPYNPIPWGGLYGHCSVYPGSITILSGGATGAVVYRPLTTCFPSGGLFLHFHFRR